jgi:hypothetical protein
MRIHRTRLGWAIVAASLLSASPALAGSLAGSHSSMVRQHEAALELAYTFVRTPAQLNLLASSGQLVRVEPTADFTLSNVSYPYARPEVRLFVERLAAQYREFTGKPMVVTSLTRPTSLQPSNASPLSVHPAGMAIDLRVPENSASRVWLEQALLAMENAGVLDVTREHTPSHFHVAVFPEAFRAYAARMDAGLSSARAMLAAQAEQLGSFVATPSRSTGPGQAVALFGVVMIACMFAGMGGVVADRGKSLLPVNHS